MLLKSLEVLGQNALSKSWGDTIPHVPGNVPSENGSAWEHENLGRCAETSKSLLQLSHTAGSQPPVLSRLTETVKSRGALLIVLSGQPVFEVCCTVMAVGRISAGNRISISL